ncbi:MAG: hypothetical protein HY574_14425 [candidate division NC10 bacterium]|nr:hypothetical protein [candidate division NC10 bacterium]
MILLTTQLQHAALMLSKRLHQLEQQIREGSNAAWPEYAQIAQALATIHAKNEQPAEYLSTRQMAARLGVSPKTLLRRKRRGQLAPAIQVGRLIRWQAGEPLRTAPGNGDIAARADHRSTKETLRSPR